jgi:DNA helicase II / ATP-dependent DNA helicase PcrA
LREASNDPDLPTLDDVIERLGGHELMERIRQKKTAEERYPSSMQRLRLLSAGVEGSAIADQVSTLLERVALSGREVGDDDAGRVNLLTLHATKGLEFSRVYIVGAEDGQFAKERDSRDELEENRRVFYVGMTRTKDRLVFTRSLSRSGKLTGGARFLDELGLPARTPSSSVGLPAAASATADPSLRSG